MGANRGGNTQRYDIAPELVNGGQATCKSDIWSLGCTLWQLWQGGSLMQIYLPSEEPDEDDEYLTQQSPFLGNQSPFLGNQSPFLGNQSPFLGNQSPFLDNQRSFIALTRAERKESLIEYINYVYGLGSAQRPGFNAILDVILRCTEPNPADRPTAQEIVSSRIWERTILPGLPYSYCDLPDQFIGYGGRTITPA